MPQSPRLTICIPTIDRSWVLRSALEGAVREMRSMPEGMVEIFVSDNGSSDDTAAVLDQLEQEYPFRRWRHPQDVGFDRNFIHCVEQARGEYVWVLGDDDQARPGSVARIFKALDDGADLCLFSALECDRDLRPLEIRSWFAEPCPSTKWLIDSPEALGKYMDRCIYMAGLCAFVSAMVFRRERFLAGRAGFEPGIGSAWVHVWAMQQYLKAPTWIHWIKEPLINNRVGNDHTEPYRRILHDFDGWIAIADAFYGNAPELKQKFLTSVRRNRGDRAVRILRYQADADLVKWNRARRALLKVGYPLALVNAVAFAHQIYCSGFEPSPGLGPEGLCLCDLKILARGARRIALVALGQFDNVLPMTRILTTLRDQTGAEQIRVVCWEGWADLLEGFDVQRINMEKLLSDTRYGDAQMAVLRAFGPDLVINGDPERGLNGDMFVATANAPGSIALQIPDAAPADLRTRTMRDEPYRQLLEPEGDWSAALVAALGLRIQAPRFWPVAAARDKAAKILAGLGGADGSVLALLGDAPELLAQPALKSSLAAALKQGWRVVGIGGGGTHAPLGQVLGSMPGAWANLGGTLDLATMGALLQASKAFLGGSGTFHVMSQVAGCPPLAGQS